MQTLETHIRLAGLLQFAVLIASAHVPFVLDWKAELARLSPFVRRLFWVYGAFIVLTIIGMAAACTLFAGELAVAGAGAEIGEGRSTGTGLARFVCGFIGVFWLARLLVQFFVFDVRDVLKTRFLLIGYHALTLIFVYLSLVFLWAAVIRRV